MANDAQDPSEPFLPLSWVPVEHGTLALTHRPKLRAIPSLRAQGATRVVTLLAAREGAERIGQLVREAGMEWTWLPLDSGRAPSDPAQSAALGIEIDALLAALRRGERLVLHCSAGIHRTGMVAYTLLRRSGLPQEEALAAIGQMRPATHDGIQPAHIAWGNAWGDAPAGDRT